MSTELEIINRRSIESSYIPQNTSQTLTEVLQRFGSFPAYSVIIGQCADGLPLMLDLSNPNPGSLLISNVSDQQATDIVNTMCLSASMINEQEDVAICVIADDSDQYLELMGHQNCQAIVAPYERLAGSLIFELSGLAEQRRYGRENGPAVLLVIDDLYSFFSHNTDYGIFVNFKWLVNYGPGSMVWPVITIRNSNLPKFTNALLSLFPLRVSESRNLLVQGSNPSQGNGRITERNGALLHANTRKSTIAFHPLQI